MRLGARVGGEPGLIDLEGRPIDVALVAVLDEHRPLLARQVTDASLDVAVFIDEALAAIGIPIAIANTAKLAWPSLDTVRVRIVRAARHFFFVAILAVVLRTAVAADPEPQPVRLGWQIPWATQGQIVQALKNTNALDLAAQPVTFVGFAYGAPLNAAALAGQVDVLFTADQPALVLLARNPSFRIVARLMYNRSCLYVPAASPAQSMRDLSGRTVMGPAGAAAERVALAALGRAGVDVAGLKLGQFDMAQQAALLQRAGKSGLWTGIDALYGFDPFPAAFEESGLARMLDCGRIVSVVVASADMVTRRRTELERFLGAFALGWVYYASQQQQANAWFVREARLDVTAAALDKSAAVEPNITARKVSDLRLDFTPQDLLDLGEAGRFLLSRGLIPKAVEPQALIDTQLVRAVLADPSLADKAQRLSSRP